MTDEPQQLDPLDEEKRAIDYIARTAEGRLLHRFLRRTLESVFIFENDGALRQSEGRRSLARDLMRLMAAGISESRASATGATTDAAILGTERKPVAVSRTRGAGRRVALEPGDGWSPEPDSGSSADTGNAA